MPSKRELFFKLLAQTSPAPLGIEIESAEGSFLFTKDGRKLLDLISGISVSYAGHGNPEVLAAINKQVAKHLHLMVYGEIVQDPQVEYASLLASYLPESLQNFYFVNSGSEAIDAALKLAAKYTKRNKIVSFIDAYHGSTIAALSVNGNENYRNHFKLLLPDTIHVPFNSEKAIEAINEQTACVLMEVIQAEAGVVPADKEFLENIKEKCEETGTLLIFDEVQTGLGRTGKMFAFEHYGVTPDILVLGKSLGGGMPLGAFIASQKIMSEFTSNPVLGHITTFGGHPVCCAAGMAALNYIIKGDYIEKANQKEAMFRKLIKHPSIKTIRGKGLMLAVEFNDTDTNMKTIENFLNKDVLTDWFLFNDRCMRICPPLTISEQEITLASHAL